MRTVMRCLFAVLVTLCASSASAQVRPGIFTTLQATSTLTTSLTVGCAVDVSSACTGGIVAGTGQFTTGIAVNAASVPTAGVAIASAVPSSTSFVLYNNSGTLTWNGIALAAGSSVSGTLNAIPRFTSVNTLGDSIIAQNAGANTVTITGTTNTTTAYQLNGTNINTGGTLTNVAYQDQANYFTNASGQRFAGGIALSAGTPSTHGIIIPSATPGSLINALYNNADTLTWPNGGTFGGTMTAGGDMIGDSAYLRDQSGAGGDLLQLLSAENLSANRTLSLILNDAGRTLTIAGNATISGTNTGDQTITLTGDVTGTGTGTFATTLATVNGNVGSFGSATAASVFTVNAKGLITAASSTTITPAVGSITGLGTGVATALAVNVGSAGAFVTFNGALGTPSSGTATNLSGTAASLSIGGSAPAGSLTGTTLAANVVTTSVTTVGTIISGVWNAGAVTSSGVITSGGTLTGVAGALSGLLTVTGSGTSAFNGAVNNMNEVRVSNTTSGTAAGARFYLSDNNGDVFRFTQYSSGFTTSGYSIASSALIEAGGSGGMGIASSGPLRFYTSTTERMRLHNSGGFSIGNTTDPGAGNLSVTGSFSSNSVTTGPLVATTANFSGLPASGSGATFICLAAAGTAVSTGATCLGSAERFKTNIRSIANATDTLMRLRPVTFDWKEPRPGVGIHDLSLIADEVAAVDRRLAIYQDGQIYSVNDRALLSLAIRTIQEQQAEIEKLKAKVN